MAIILRTLTGEAIPVEHRRDGLQELFAIEASDGTIRYLDSDVEAAHLVAVLSEEEKRSKS